MSKTYLSSVLFALLAGASLAVSAAPAAVVEPVVSSVQMAVQASTEKVDLNTADAATLQSSLSGIGSAKAMAIITHREAHGAFTSVDELLEVKGIGQALLDKNRDKLMIK